MQWTFSWRGFEAHFVKFLSFKFFCKVQFRRRSSPCSSKETFFSLPLSGYHSVQLANWLVTGLMNGPLINSARRVFERIFMNKNWPGNCFLAREHEIEDCFETKSFPNPYNSFQTSLACSSFFNFDAVAEFLNPKWKFEKGRFLG